ncbi:MAG: adenylyl-sulfate kinase, partial [Bacteroidaceae bacterium]|nr:adenylyl-sulfate kinase [Bacteroidaceae bacterium]
DWDCGWQNGSYTEADLEADLALMQANFSDFLFRHFRLMRPDASERELAKRGILCRILDGDNIRAGINSNLGFSQEDRRENIRRIAEIGKLFVETGIVTIACFVSPTNELRQMAREIIGAKDFREVYIATPLEECERRDVKGLYARARRGEVKDFTGISAPFEAPGHPDLSLDTSRMTLKEEVEAVVKLCL